MLDLRVTYHGGGGTVNDNVLYRVCSPCSHTRALGDDALHRLGSSLRFPGDLERSGWSW